MLNNTIKLLKDLRRDYNHPWPNEDDLTKLHRLTMLDRLVEEQCPEKVIQTYIPFDKSHYIRMSILDMIHLGKLTHHKFIVNDRLSDDLISLQLAIDDWLSDSPTIHVGESGTLYRFFQFPIWKKNLDKTLDCRGTLTTRKIIRDKTIINLPQEELLKLDNGTSQWASAAALWGDMHRVSNPPYKLLLTYNAIENWHPDWTPIEDDTIFAQALYFYNLLKGKDTNFIPTQSEDFCFAYAFGKMTKEEGLKKWPALQSHESNRIIEIEKNFDYMMNGRKVVSKDHRVVQALTMWAKVNDKNINVEHPGCVFKSWPFFWSFLENF
jgi:hypothetical protein